jgi:hypothetical protein
VVILQQRQQKKITSQYSELNLKFRVACSAAGPELEGYTQWVRWRAPTLDYKKRKQEPYPDGRPRRQELLRVLLESGALGVEPGQDFLRGRVQNTRTAPRRPIRWGGAGSLGVRDRRASGPDLQWPRC